MSSRRAPLFRTLLILGGSHLPVFCRSQERARGNSLTDSPACEPSLIQARPVPDLSPFPWCFSFHRLLSVFPCLLRFPSFSGSAFPSPASGFSVPLESSAPPFSFVEKTDAFSASISVGPRPPGSVFECFSFARQDSFLSCRGVPSAERCERGCQALKM